jgi:fluoride ion exporter CrcB/FEX
MNLHFIWFLLLVGLFGGLGAVLRASLVQWNGFLAWGLLVANTLAAALVAWIWSGPPLPAGTNEILIVGFAGGLSTFSTVAKASFDFYHRGRIAQALSVLTLNLFVPLGAVMLVGALS